LVRLKKANQRAALNVIQCAALVKIVFGSVSHMGWT